MAGVVSVFASLKAPIHRNRFEPKSEGLVNSLHFKLTASMLFACSLLVTCLEWVGNGSKISCVLEGKEDDWTIAKLRNYSI